MNVANERVLYMYTKPNQKNKPRPGLVVTQSDETQSIKMVTKKGGVEEINEKRTWNARRL